MESEDKEYRSVTMVVKLPAELNKKLTISSALSNRTKIREAELRLVDHLTNFEFIASPGNRFMYKDKALIKKLGLD